MKFQTLKNTKLHMLTWRVFVQTVTNVNVTIMLSIGGSDMVPD